MLDVIVIINVSFEPCAIVVVSVCTSLCVYVMMM